MTGHTTKAIAAQGTKTDVAVTLERTVAKIAGTGIHDGRVLGTLFGQSADQLGRALESRLSEQPDRASADPEHGAHDLYSHAGGRRELSGEFRYPFDVPENGELAEGSRPAADPRRDIRPRRQLLDATDDQAEVAHSHRTVRRRRGPVPSQRILPRTGPDRPGSPAASRADRSSMSLRGRLGAPRQRSRQTSWTVVHSFGAGAVPLPLTPRFKLYRLW